jgi:hypothetical protein|nr:MAG TPA: hypothetical protein [Caudoviricetes sp.]
MATKNLGQVSGVHIGSTPPSNTILIWYDSTPSQLRHKVYDPTLKQWVVLDQNIISAITYSELTNMAKNSGLSVGEYFQITDRSNALALAITSTKVQYCDALGNILIDDLGTNIQYHVTSSNLQIDDVVGVFDETNRKLVFQFNEQTPDFTADDYVLGKVQRNNIWSLAKYKLSSFLSKVTGNSITWNGGFFFSFSDALKNVLDKAGGVVSKTTYDRDKEQLTTSINNVGKENQNIIQNAHNELTEATKPDSFYGTQLPSISTGGEATDIAKGDTLLNIVSKIQRYINKFKYATSIRISQDFTDRVSPQYVNNNDTVDSAIRKIQYWLKNMGKGGKLSEDWEPKDYTTTVEDVAAGDTFDDAFAKAVAKLSQIGDITNGRIQSKATVNGSEYTRRTDFNLANGSLTFNRDVSGGSNQQTVQLNRSSGLYINNASGKSVRISGEGVSVNANTNQGFQLPNYEDSWGLGIFYGAAAALFTGAGASLGGYTSVKYAAGISALCSRGTLGSSVDIFDAYFSRLKAGSISFGRASMQDSDLYITNDCSFVTCTNTEDRNVYLPTTPFDGLMVIINQVNTANVAVQGNGHKIVDNGDVDYINIGGARRIAVFLYHANLASPTGLGAWLFTRWSR